MRKSSLAALGIVALAIGSSGVASAADIPARVYKAPPPTVASYNWTGFYLGANVGYAWGKDRSVTLSPNDIVADAIDTPPPIAYDPRGGLAGVQIGYNWQIARNFLAGLEADFDFSNIKGGGTSTFLSPILGAFGTPPLLTQFANERIEWFGTVRARLGFLVTDNVLIYGTGGFAYSRVEQSLSLFNNNISFGTGNIPISVNCNQSATCFAGSSTRTRTGWTAGAGLEFAAWNRWRMKAEYLFVRFGGNQFNQTALETAFGFPVPSSYAAQFSDTDFHVARIGLNYGFAPGPVIARR